MSAAPALFAPSATEEIALYDWQAEAVESLRRNIREGVRCQILAAPTGAGKTVLAAHLLRECQQKGRRAVFVCDRVNLIAQTSQTFDRYGIAHGIIQGANERTQPWSRIQLASAQTLTRRGWPDADLIIVDEAHSLYRDVLHRIARKDTTVIGLTATPFTRGLGRHYERVVTVRTTRQLIADGYLADFDIFAASEPDMRGAKISAGEWTDDDAEARSMPIIGDVVSEYLKHGGGRKFIAFGVNVRHCAEIQRQMMAAGVVCALYTYHTPDGERRQMLADFAERGGHLQGLISVAALAKGFDNPSVEVVILARPLRKSLAEHIQMIGRGLRRDPDNPGKRAIVLDHSGNCVRFWAPMHDFFDFGAPALDTGKQKEKAKPQVREREPMKCPACAAVHDPRPTCPICGHEYVRASDVLHLPGTLSKLTGRPEGSPDDRQSFYSQLLAYADERGWNEGAAAHKFAERFGHFPDGLAKTRAAVTPATRTWVRNRIVAWSRAKKKSEAA